MTIDFGSDFAGFSDVTALFEERGSDDPWIVPEALLRRLSTTRGSNPDDLDYGYNVAELLRMPMTGAELATVPGRIRAECMKDDRVETADVKLERTSPTSFLLRLSGETAVGSFDLVAGIEDGVLREIDR